MELPRRFSERIVFNTRPKTEEHTLFLMDKTTHEENLSQPIQTLRKQVNKVTVTFPTGYTGFVYVTNKNKKDFFAK